MTSPRLLSARVERRSSWPRVKAELLEVSAQAPAAARAGAGADAGLSFARHPLLWALAAAAGREARLASISFYCDLKNGPEWMREA